MDFEERAGTMQHQLHQHHHQQQQQQHYQHQHAMEGNGAYGHASSGSNGRMVPTPAGAPYINPGMVGGSAMSMMPPHYLSSLHGGAPAMASMFAASELKTERKLFLPFLEQLLDDETIEGLHWIDRDKRIFRMPWKHMKRHDYIQEKDAALFKAWAVNSGKYKESDPDPSRWKINFRSALNTMKHVFVEILDENVDRDDCRIFRINAPPSETNANRKRRPNLVPVMAQARQPSAQPPIKPCPVTAACPTFADFNQAPNNQAEPNPAPQWHPSQPQPLPGAHPPPGWSQPQMAHHPNMGQPVPNWAPPGAMAMPAMPWQQPGLTVPQQQEMKQMHEAQMKAHDEMVDQQEQVEMAKAQFDLINVAEAGEPTCLEGIFNVIFNGVVSNLRLQIVLHPSFPQQPPDVVVIGRDLDMVQRCESLVQQLEYNTYWSRKSCKLVGFLEAIACELEKCDLIDIRSTVPANSHATIQQEQSTGAATQASSNGAEQAHSGNEADTQNANGNGRGATTSNLSEKSMLQERRKPSAFQPYRKRPRSDGSGPEGNAKRLFTEGAHPALSVSSLARMNTAQGDQQRQHAVGTGGVPGPTMAALHEQAMAQRHHTHLQQTRSLTPNPLPALLGARNLAEPGNGHAIKSIDLPAEFKTVEMFCLHLQEQYGVREQQLAQKNATIMEYMVRIRELEKHTGEFQHALQAQAYECAELRHNLQLKSTHIDKLESQLSVSKYYLNTANQKLQKSPFLTQLQRSDRERVDIRVRHRPQPIIAAMSADEATDKAITAVSRQTRSSAEHVERRDDTSEQGASDSHAISSDPCHSRSHSPPAARASPKDSIAATRKGVPDLTEYESKCVPWEGFSSSENSNPASPTELMIDVDEPCDENSAPQACLGHVYFENEAASHVTIIGQSGREQNVHFEPTSGRAIAANFPDDERSSTAAHWHAGRTAAAAASTVGPVTSHAHAEQADKDPPSPCSSYSPERDNKEDYQSWQQDPSPVSATGEA